jgi:hypothetical protein
MRRVVDETNDVMEAGLTKRRGGTLSDLASSTSDPNASQGELRSAAFTQTLFSDIFRMVRGMGLAPAMDHMAESQTGTEAHEGWKARGWN